MLCHDIEFVEMQQIVDETIPALRRIQQAGKVRFIGFSGYPMKIFKFILDQTTVDCALSYNQYTLQNTRFADEIVPYLKSKGVGAMNAGPFSARLLTNAPLPAWLKEPEDVKAAARKAAAHCAAKGVDIAKLALQFSLAHPDIATTISGSANPQNIRNWATWAAEPIDQQLLKEVLAIFAPVKNLGHVEGLLRVLRHQEGERRLGREVALKRLPEGLRRHHPRALQFFLREAQSAARLSACCWLGRRSKA